MKERGSKPSMQLSSPLSVERLTKAKKTALRRGIWFRTLNRLERGIIDLTVRYVENIKSTKLAKIVTAIIEKLHLAMESTLDKAVRSVGLFLARKISEIAVSWGNLLASKWVDDLSFAKFLTLNFSQTRNGLES
jgi:hypothetical protein